MAKMILRPPKEVGDAVVRFLQDIVIIADKYNWDRDNLVKIAAATIYEVVAVATFKDYKVGGEK